MTETVKTFRDFLDITPVGWDHSSPSQIKAFRRCARRWWFEKVAGCGSTSTEATELGTRVHTVIEHYLKNRTVLDDQAFQTPEWLQARAIAEKGYAFLPEPGTVPHHLIEAPFRLATDVVPIVGYIDLVWEGKSSEWCVTDHKTIGNMRYALTDVELRMDAQCAVYTTALLEDLPDLKTVEFRHIYYQTKAPGAKESRVTLHRDEVADRYGSAVETVRRQHAFHLVTSAADVPGNPKACDDYKSKTNPHGCQFRPHCDVGKAPVFKFSQPKLDLSTVKDMGILNSLSPEARADLEAKLVAAGHEPTLLKRMNDSAIKGLAHQLVDPINPPDATAEPAPEVEDDAEGEKEDKEEDVPQGPPTADKMHWKQRRTLMAQLKGVTLEALTAEMKAAGWQAADEIAELKRLQAGHAPSPLIAKPPKEPLAVDATPKPAKPAVQEPPAEVPQEVDGFPVKQTVLAVIGGTKVFHVHIADLPDAKVMAVVPDLPGRPKVVAPGNSSIAFLMSSVNEHLKTAFPTSTIEFKPFAKDLPPAPPAPAPVTAPAPAPAPKQSGREVAFELSIDIGDTKTKVTFFKGSPRTVRYVRDGKTVEQTFPTSMTTAEISRLISTGEAPLALPVVVAEPKPAPAPAPAPVEKKVPFQNLVTQAQTPAPIQAPTPAPPDQPKTPEAPPEPAPAKKLTHSFTLCKDCKPRGVAYMTLVELLKPLMVSIEAQNNLHYYNAVAFSEGKAAIAAELQKGIMTGTVTLPSVLVVETYMPAAPSCLEVLERYATAVFER